MSNIFHIDSSKWTGIEIKPHPLYMVDIYACYYSTFGDRKSSYERAIKHVFKIWYDHGQGD